jgi:hypothetical protein
MKRFAATVAVLVGGGCGGGRIHRPYAPPEPDDHRHGEEVELSEDEPIEEREDDGRRYPLPPEEWRATVTLEPVHRATLRPLVLTMTQVEGEGVRIVSQTPIEGLGRGVYHLVVHEGRACGRNATKVGAPFEAAAVDMPVVVMKGETPTIDDYYDLMLDGRWSIVGRTLVLHADRKGQPGKALGCGTIAFDDEE